MKDRERTVRSWGQSTSRPATPGEGRRHVAMKAASPANRRTDAGRSGTDSAATGCDTARIGLKGGDRTLTIQSPHAPCAAHRRMLRPTAPDLQGRPRARSMPGASGDRWRGHLAIPPGGIAGAPASAAGGRARSMPGVSGDRWRGRLAIPPGGIACAPAGAADGQGTGLFHTRGPRLDPSAAVRSRS